MQQFCFTHRMDGAEDSRQGYFLQGILNTLADLTLELNPNQGIHGSPQSTDYVWGTGVNSKKCQGTAKSQSSTVREERYQPKTI